LDLDFTGAEAITTAFFFTAAFLAGAFLAADFLATALAHIFFTLVN
jgi:hypothetical protein